MNTVDLWRCVLSRYHIRVCFVPARLRRRAKRCGQVAVAIALVFTLVCACGCATTESELPWNAPQPWEGSVTMPGFSSP